MQPKNCVIYEAPSMLDKKPIFAALVGLSTASNNSATGAMLQVYIMRSDISPMEAVNSGADSSVCGSCSLRGEVMSLEAAAAYAESLPSAKRRALLARIVISAARGESSINVRRPCYVRLEQAPTGIYKLYKKGGYPVVSTREAVDYVRRRDLRVGAYGDGAALPIGVIRPLVDAADVVTNYTHAAGYAPGRADRLAGFTMASCESVAQAKEYQSRGLRTFRVSPNFQEKNGVRRVVDLLPGEIQCIKTLNKSVQCIKCKLCDGWRGKYTKNIVAPVHGKGAAYL